MSWTFDSGLPKPIRTLVQNAVVAKLAPLVKPTGFLFCAIPIGYGIASAHDELGIDLLANELKNRTPAIAVAVCDCHDEPAGAPDRSIGKLDVDLYFMTTHRRGATAGRATGDAAAAADDTRDPGLHAIMQLAWQLLYKSSMVLDGTKPASQQRAQPMGRISESEIITTEEYSLWKQRWTTQITLDVNLYRGVIQQLVEAYTTLSPTGDEPEAKHMVVHSTPGP